MHLFQWSLYAWKIFGAFYSSLQDFHEIHGTYMALCLTLGGAKGAEAFKAAIRIILLFILPMLILSMVILVIMLILAKRKIRYKFQLSFNFFLLSLAKRCCDAFWRCHLPRYVGKLILACLGNYLTFQVIFERENCRQPW